MTMTGAHGRTRTTPTPMTRAGVVVLVVTVAVVLLGLTASPARAHGADAGVRYRLTGVEPAMDGLTVQVVRGLAGQLVLANDTDRPVEVLDDTGRAFLRIGPDGVEADVASASWQASDRPFGLGEGAATPSSASPRWVQLSDQSSWGWYDHRLHASELAAPPDADGPVVLSRWAVPLRVGEVRATVTGETVAGPAAGMVAARLVSDAEPADGVRVTLLPGVASGLLVEVGEGRTVVVRGETGEPFLRLLEGQVEANLSSPTWHRVGGSGVEATSVDADASPDWQRVASGRQYGWIEPRAAAPEVDGDPPDGQVLSTWAVPIEVDGRPSSIVGELRWVRTASTARPETGGLPLANVALAAVGLGAIVALVLVRRRSSARRAAARQ